MKTRLILTIFVDLWPNFGEFEEDFHKKLLDLVSKTYIIGISDFHRLHSPFKVLFMLDCGSV